MTTEEIKDKRKEKWLEVIFMIEALGIEKDVVKNALETHIQKLESLKSVLVYEKKFGDIEKVENPMKGVKEAYSQVVEVKLFAKDMFTLVNIVLVYGPSAVEILGPDRKEIALDEVQNLANLLAGVVHQFAAAGAGGIIISPERK
ncbi:MAG: hypothetical protein HYU56_00565 [Candidatus Aenigmarchaeota archaeon]|nr:hypothetical protein [Candidatus Aenigmarchaeota archaeon]